MVIETIMKWWAMITSLVIVGGFIYGIYLTIQIFLLPGVTPWWIYIIPLSMISGLLFYSPFFYYGWVKKPNNQSMKLFTKGVTIVYVLGVLFGSISSYGLDFPKDFIFIIPTFILLTPLFYFGWRKS